MISQYGLSFIKDEDLYNHVKTTVERYKSFIDLKTFNKNLIDPIKLTFDGKIYKKSIKDLIEAEVMRQGDKANNNHIGYFNQNIFHYLGGADWEVLPKGFDIANKKKKIFVEMKNKHNTMNSSSGAKTLIKMQDHLIKDPDATFLLVEVIAQKSQNSPWQVSIEGEKTSRNEKIRRVSIDQFYEMVTGEKEAFFKLCCVLSKVLDDVLLDLKENLLENTVLQELQEIYGEEKDLMKTFFLLTFNSYEGFSSLN